MQKQNLEPFLVLLIRNTKNHPRFNLEEYLIHDILKIHSNVRSTNQTIEYLINSDYYLVIKNCGSSVAHDIKITNEKFKVIKYQKGNILPKEDEEIIKIKMKDGKKIQNLTKLNNQIVNIHCRSPHDKSYIFKWRILDVEKLEVERIIKKGDK